MKRIISVILCTAVMAAAVIAAGCGGPDMSDSKYLGKRQAKTAQYSGFKLGVEDAIGGEFYFTLNEDATVDLVVTGDKVSGTWEESEGGVVIKDDEQELQLTDVDGNLVMNYSGMVLTFEHE